MNVNRFLVIMGLGLASVSCGGGGLGSSSTTPPTTNASAAGIWVGTDSASGLALTGVVNSSGLADFIRSDGVQYIGTVQVCGSALALSVDVYTQFGTQFADA